MGEATPVGESRSLLLILFTEKERAVSLVRLLAGRYETIAAPLSAATSRWLNEAEPDLVLLDPPTEPKALLSSCERLRDLTPRPNVVLSEVTNELIIARVLASGIDEFFVLPMGDQELMARIDALVRRIHRAASPPENEHAGGLLLSALDLSVEYDGRKISLSPTEFRLLSCLASIPGKVFTHETLMSRVWGAEYVDSRHYLHIYVRYLREKLEADPTNPQMIISEWGVGYRFQPPEPSTA